MKPKRNIITNITDAKVEAFSGTREELTLFLMRQEKKKGNAPYIAFRKSDTEYLIVFTKKGSWGQQFQMKGDN